MILLHVLLSSSKQDTFGDVHHNNFVYHPDFTALNTKLCYSKGASPVLPVASEALSPASVQTLCSPKSIFCDKQTKGDYYVSQDKDRNHRDTNQHHEDRLALCNHPKVRFLLCDFILINRSHYQKQTQVLSEVPPHMTIRINEARLYKTISKARLYQKKKRRQRTLLEI